MYGPPRLLNPTRTLLGACWGPSFCPSFQINVIRILGQSVCVSNASVSGGNRCYRNDLLVAADSVTSAMSTLVRELNSGKKSISTKLSIVFSR